MKTIIVESCMLCHLSSGCKAFNSPGAVFIMESHRIHPDCPLSNDAVEFADWIMKNNIAHSVKYSGKWITDYGFKTSEELYKIFKEHI